MTRRLVSGAVAGLFAAAVTGGALAQTTGYVPGTAPAPAPTENSGYVRNAYPTPTDGIVKSGVYNSTKGLSGNLCYRTGYWTPAMATIQCDPDLVPKPPAPKPAAAPPPPPAAAPVTPPSFMVFFDWDRSNLSAQALNTIKQAAGAYKAKGNARITATGHTDTSGSESYNMALSLRRANAVKDALVREGVPATNIAVLGRGEQGLLVQTGPNVREPQNRRVEIVIQ